MLEQSTAAVHQRRRIRPSQPIAYSNHSRLGAKLRVPNRPQKIDVQLNGGERFFGSEGGALDDAHSGIGYIAQHAAVKGTHRI